MCGGGGGGGGGGGLRVFRYLGLINRMAASPIYVERTFKHFLLLKEKPCYIELARIAQLVACLGLRFGV